MKFLQGVWKFINSKIFGYIIIIVFAILFIGTCGRNSSLKKESNRKDQNIYALNDSITTVILKNGNLQSSKSAYISTINDLENYNLDLYQKIHDQSGKLVTLGQIIFNLKQDSTKLADFISNFTKPEPPIQINDSSWNIPWELSYIYDSTNYDIFKGNTQISVRGVENYLKRLTIIHDKTWMNYRDSQIELTWGQKYEDGKLKVFAQTAHPAFSTQLLEGVYVDFPKKKHWFTGFGVGPQFNIGYDFLHNQPAVVIGVGIHYNIYSW